MISPSSPVTGGAQTGFTSPTYTLTADTVPPGANAKQWAVTGLGGTQTGATVHSVSKPFTLAFFKPVSLNMLPQAQVTSGVIKNIRNNVYKLITRKGAIPAANQVPALALIKTEISIPAGTDTFEPAELRAALSAHIGMLSQISAGIGDTATSGVM